MYDIRIDYILMICDKLVETSKCVWMCLSVFSLCD